MLVRKYGGNPSNAEVSKAQEVGGLTAEMEEVEEVVVRAEMVAVAEELTTDDAGLP